MAKSEFALVNKIIAHYELGEAGKLETFFAKVRKTLAREVETLNKRVELLEFNYQRSMEDLQEQITDAEEAYDNSFLQINVEDATSNADIDQLIPQYWRGIELAKANLETLKEKRDTITEAYEESKTEEGAQIIEREHRLEVISAGN